MAKAVICGYYGQGNAGDEALLACLLAALPDYVTPTVISANPRQTQTRFGVASCDRVAWLSILQALRDANTFIWGGGSLIQDATSALSPLYYCGLMGLAQQLGLKTIAWAQGIGPLNRRLTSWTAQRAFQGCRAISVRDAASAELLSQWDVKFMIAPDPVWTLEPLPVAGIADIRAPRVAVTLRTHQHLTSSRLEVLTKALQDFQTATGASILFVPFQLARDLEISRTLQSQMPGESHIIALEDPRQLRAVFASAEMAIAMRYHALIMAAASECRCFALSYDPKITQLMTELELPGWDLTQLPSDATTISRAWLEHYANGQALSPPQIQSLTERAAIHKDLLIEALWYG